MARDSRFYIHPVVPSRSEEAEQYIFWSQCRPKGPEKEKNTGKNAQSKKKLRAAKGAR
jgi:hypothetical protein